MSSSRDREESPDWLRTFKAPNQSTVVSLASDSSPSNSLSGEDESDHRKSVSSDSGEQLPFNKTSKKNSSKRKLKIEDDKPSKKKKADNQTKKEGRKVGRKNAEELSDGHVEHAPNHSVWTLSSDSEASPNNSPMRKDDDAVPIGVIGDFNQVSEKKSPKTLSKVQDKKKKLHSDVKREGEGVPHETPEKNIGPHVSSSMLPLVLSDKVHRSKALVECEGDSIDLSGDMGAVGRVVISETPSKCHEMFLDLKGTIYKTTIVPSRTFCTVSFGQSEAKIEGIMNDFIQLKPQSNVYEAETMVEGTLDGFSFDSEEDDADKVPKATKRSTDQNEGAEEHTNGKTKGKAAKARKGKAAGGKPVKKVKRKSQAPKKATARK